MSSDVFNKTTQTLLAPPEWTTLLGDEFGDNFVFMWLLLLSAFLITVILARIVYFQPRAWLTGKNDSDTLSYQAQARVVMYDNLSRRVFNQSNPDVSPAIKGRYGQRGFGRAAFVYFMSFFGFGCTVMFTCVGLPSKEGIFAETESILRWQTKSPDRYGLLVDVWDPCISTGVVDGANVNPTSTWLRCSTYHCELKNQSGSKNNTDIQVVLFKPETYSRFELTIQVQGDTGICFLSFRTYLQMNSSSTHFVEFVANSTQLERDLLANMHALRNRSGLLMKKSGEPIPVITFQLDISKVQILHGYEDLEMSEEITRMQHASMWFIAMMQGIFSYEGTGSRMLPLSDRMKRTPAANTRIQVARYNGTILPARCATIFTAVLLVLYFVTCCFLRNTPGLAWEVVTAHGRKCADHLLTGPDTKRRLCRSRDLNNPRNCYVGYTVPRGYEEVAEKTVFTEDDTVEAIPFCDGQECDEENGRNKIMYWP